MKMSDQEFRRQLADANQRGEEELRTRPWATAVKYDRRQRRIVVTLNKGIVLSVPISLIPEVKRLRDESLARVAVLPPGFHLDWEAQDIQVSVDHLLAEASGPRAALATIGRKGGASTSKAKSAASRANGAKGGRPRKSTVAP